uniref:sex comb on midleg like protein isoform X2 n=1 Tax=Ciona intestinalis TaxID=7719 RepID=UPI00089DB963|nr:sex comb on midleg like protein isoform X2 [Ciona intestinalis]|eukprot:XP_018671726.1 sex comb on midleg like protein isoform X2 [Ciona intestinalis]
MSRRASNESSKSSNSTIGSNRKIKASKMDSGESGEFSWERYLQHTGMKPADLVCFKQTSDKIPLDNKFEVSQKLETTDARNPSAISVATIVAIQGPRLCLRLDGTDGCNDFWRLCDSKDIFPLGTCAAHGGLLQPPLGFTKNVSTWPSFLQRTLQGGHHADSSCFLQEPKGPDENMFEVGMKLEAIDRKNPHLICPATIGDVDGDQVFISFDGWRGTFDYWATYDSRDLFPVGWCNINDHPIQQPGFKGENPVVGEKLRHLAEQSKRQTRSVTNQPEPKSSNQKDIAPPSAPTKPTRRRDKVLRREVKKVVDDKSYKVVEKKETAASSNVASDSSNSSEESDSSQDFNDSAIKVEKNEEETTEPTTTTTEIPSSCKTEVKTENQLNQLSVYEIQRLERKARKRRRKQKRILKVLRRAGLVEGEVPDVGGLSAEQLALLSSPRKRKISTNEGDFMLSKYLKKKKKRKAADSSSYTRMEGFGVKVNDIISKSPISPTSPSFLDVVGSTPTSLFGAGKSPILRGATQGWPTKLGSVVTSDNKLGRFDIPSSEGATVDKPAASTGCVSTTTTPGDPVTTATLDRSTPPPSVSSTTNPPNVEENNVSSTTNPPSRPPSVNPHDPKPCEVVTSTRPLDKPRSRNPTKWSVNDVVSYIGEREPALQPHLHLFNKHEIDGAALLLLNNNNIVKFMSLKLGPTLKLCSLVEGLKEKVARHCKRHK